MRIALQLTLLACGLVSQGAIAKVIYGEDNRVEVDQATAKEMELARSAVTMVSKTKINRDDSGLVQLEQLTLRNWLESSQEEEKEKMFSPKVVEAANKGISFCAEEKFVDQPNPGMCSGFLIAPDLVVTAGHCVVLPNFCEEFEWVFDFKVDESNKTAGLNIKEENIYSCKKVISNTLSGALNLDYAIVQLDRVVKDRTPLEFRTDSIIEDNSAITVIGNPSGLPLKVASGANVRNNAHPLFFNANLDTFQGNSGSAVFNSITGVVEGILVRGENDYVANAEKACVEANRCKDEECRGEDVTRITSIPEIAIMSTLMAAARDNDDKMIEVLGSLRTWIDFYGKDGQSALMKSAAAGSEKSLKALLKLGADITLADAEGNTALHHLAGVLNPSKIETFNILMEGKANLEALNLKGETALEVAARMNNSEAYVILIKAGANIHADLRNNVGQAK